VRALRNYPDLAHTEEVVKLLDGRFTSEGVKEEVEYLGHKLRETFERTYGWAWLLKLAAEVRVGASTDRGGHSAPHAVEAFARWDKILAPMADAFVDRFLKFSAQGDVPDPGWDA